MSGPAVLPDPEMDLLGWMRAADEAGGWMLTKQMAALLGVTPEWLCHARRRGRLPARVSARLDRRHILWCHDAVIDWAASKGADDGLSLGPSVQAAPHEETGCQNACGERSEQPDEIDQHFAQLHPL